MKVLQITTLVATRSTGRNTIEMHRALQERGIESYIAAAPISVDEGDFGQYIVGSKVGMKAHALLSRITGLQSYFSTGATKKLCRQIDELAPDVVLLGILHSNFVNLNVLLQHLKERGIMTVLVLHDFWFMTGHCTHPVQTGCMKYTDCCGHCDQKKCCNPSWFFDTSRKVHADRIRLFSDWPEGKLAVVGVSDWVTEGARLSAALGHCKNIHTIYNWIDPAVFHPGEPETAKKSGFTVLAVSTNWDETKGLYDLVTLSERLTDEELLIVGHISEADRRLFHYTNIHFVDFTNSVDVLADLYRSADVFVTCSYYETFGKVIAEAISCGTPAIVYDTTAMPELVEGGCGYAVPVGNVDAMYEKVQDVKALGKGAFADACREKSRKCFDFEQNIEKYVRIFSGEMADI